MFRLGHKKSGLFGRVGLKVSRHGHRVGSKVNLAQHAEQAEDVAGQVGDVAGKIGKYAGMGAAGAAMVGLEPVAAALGGVAGLAKGVQAGAEYVGDATGAVRRIKKGFAAADRL